MIAGKYQSQPPFPFTPGGEVAGTIAATGANVTEFAPGDRVFGGVGHGGFAERVALPARRLFRMPESMSFAQASGISTTYGTSYYALKDRAALQPGENLLVLGAGGGSRHRGGTTRQGHGRPGHRRREFGGEARCRPRLRG